MRILRQRLVVAAVLSAFAAGILAGQTDVEALRIKAEQGNAPAQRALGFRYANGQGVPQDDAAALKWVRLAAQQGATAAQANLSTVYGKGEGVPRDLVLAYVWISMAVLQMPAAAPSKEITTVRLTIHGRAATDCSSMA